MGDFGGDYGNYLKLLESNSALGYNPQSDPIGDNQVSNIFIFLTLFLEGGILGRNPLKFSKFYGWSQQYSQLCLL